MRHRYFDIPGWFQFFDVYDRAVAHFPDGSHFVEVGCWKGRSTAYLAVAITNSGKDIRLDVVDTFEGSEDHRAKGIDCSGIKEEFMKNLDGLIGPRKPIRQVLQRPSVEAADFYTDGSLDFVFLDASHEAEDVAADIRAWKPKLKPSGVLAGDDLGWESVQRGLKSAGVREIALSGEKSAWIVPNGNWEPWMTPMEKT